MKLFSVVFSGDAQIGFTVQFRRRTRRGWLRVREYRCSHTSWLRLQRALYAQKRELSVVTYEYYSIAKLL